MVLHPPSKAFGTWFWQALALLAMSALTIAALFWIFDHPFGTNWDESRYINNAFKDVANFRQGGLLELLKGLVAADRTRPPAFRLLVLPFTLPFGVHPAVLRLVSFACLWVTVAFTYLAAKRIAGETAGAFAALFLLACPIVVGPHMRFYVDYPLYVAIAALFYFLFADWNQENPSSRHWVGLGLALGLGGMAKPPIIFIAVPVVLLTLVLQWFKVITTPTPGSLLKAAGLAIAVMLPWWVFNFSPAIKKSFRSGGYVRHSLGPQGSLATLADWFNVLVQSMLGVALTLLLLAIVVTLLIQLFRKQLVKQFRFRGGQSPQAPRLQNLVLSIPVMTQLQAGAIGVCLAGSLPMLALSAVGTNNNPRLIAPALVPLAIAIGILAAVTGWTTSRWFAVVAVAILCFQLTLMVSPSAKDGTYQTGDAAAQHFLWGNPTTVMRRIEQWDWFQLKALCDRQKLQNPVIAYLGNSLTLNVPQIARPWVQVNEEVRINWLWEFRKGAIDWNQVMTFADASNVVVVAPNLKGSALDRQDLDNQHNTELIQRLQNNPRFATPITLTLGRFEPMPVLLFLHKPGQAPSSVPPEMKTNPFQ